MEQMHKKFQNKILEITEKRKEKNLQNDSFPENTIWNSIEIFTYSPDEEITFAEYYKKYTDVYNEDCQSWSEGKKVRLLLSKLGTAEHNKLVNYILPKKTSELTFTEAVNILSELFSKKTCLFHKRWKCLNLMKDDEQDYITYAVNVNKHCEEFKLAELSADNFKCLVFVQGGIGKRRRVEKISTGKIGKRSKYYGKEIGRSLHKYVSVKKNKKKIEQSGDSHVRKIRYKEESQSTKKNSKIGIFKQKVKYQRKINKNFRSHVLLAVNYTGTDVAILRIKNISTVKEWDIKAGIAGQKIKTIK